MNNALKICVLVGTIGMAMSPADAGAAVVNHTFLSNAINYCQAFTPGPENTIRNRVIGSENIGADPIAVACNFHSMGNGAAGNTPPTVVEMWFGNNNFVGSITITCSMLTGRQAQGGPTQYLVTKSVTLAAGGRGVLVWGPADNPVAGSTDLGNYLVGVNCTLPFRGVMADTYLNWRQDNGV